MNPEFQRCLERKKIVPFEKGHTLTDAFYAGMILRENADYRSDFSKSGALAVIRNAEDFLNKATAILRN